MGFYLGVWCPKLIIAQMIALQSAFYLVFGAVVIFWSVLFQQTIALDQLFLFSMVDFNTAEGRLTITAFLMTSLVCAFVLVGIVERSKKCLDFVFTWHFVHWLACWYYGGSPSTYGSLFAKN